MLSQHVLGEKEIVYCGSQRIAIDDASICLIINWQENVVTKRKFIGFYMLNQFQD